jgi:hypothetical protein
MKSILLFLLAVIGIIQFNGEPRYRIMPNYDLTPGHIMETNDNLVCQKGYSRTVRYVSMKKRKQVYEDYGVKYPQIPGNYEVDHFIPLSLGGSNELENLWVQPSPEFRWKDKVEFVLWRKVCKNEITLLEAQKIIKNWYSYYEKIKDDKLKSIKCFSGCS